jgi:16S rRNA (guanine(527)-N(7))-methyltransferase RsmG
MPLLTDAFLDRMEIFAQTLALWGTRANLTAKPEDAAEIAFHIVDSLMPLPVLPDPFQAGNQILDFGSGAGFPGLILASLCPARFTLAESRQKRASFLKVAAAQMGLDNVEILPFRLQPAALTPSFHAALSRASGPPIDFYRIAGSTLIPGGVAILYASPSQRLELASAQANGLAGYQRHSYSLRHRKVLVNGVLAVWRKQENPQ